ncbi:MAG: hypothetical protein AAFO07_12360 [Bacteroidota bacterium]
MRSFTFSPLIKRVALLLLAICSFYLLHAQDPEIKVDTISDNIFKFYVEWPSGPGADFTNPPPPLVDGQQVSPRWNYIWYFSDGYVATTDTVVHAFESPGTYTAGVRTTGTYTGNRPPRNRLETPIPVNNISDQINQTNFYRIEDRDLKVKIVPHVGAARVQDTLLCAVIYRTGGLGNDDVFSTEDIEVELDLPDSIDVLDYDWESMTYTPKNREPNGSYLWFQPNPNNTQSREGIFWVGLIFNPGLIDLQNLGGSSGSGSSEAEWGVLDTVINIPQGSHDVPGFGPLVYDDSITAVVRYVNPPQQDRRRDVEFNTNPLNLDLDDDQGGDNLNEPAIFNPGAKTILGLTYERNMRVNSARDPNNIIVEQKRLPPGEDFTLEYTINFENLGNDAAALVVLFPFFDDRLDIESVQSATGFFRRSPTADKNVDLTWLPNVPSWSFDPTGGKAFVLPSKSQAIEFGFNPEHAEGFVNFKVRSKPGVKFNVGDTIKTWALIRMDLDSVVTNVASTVIVDANDINFSLPWKFGAKVGINYLFEDSNWLRAGFHAGITARKALGKVDYSLKDNPVILVSDLPQFWYQPELMYSQIEINNSGFGALTWNSIDLVPLQIRWVPKINKLLIFGPRSLAVSAGYTASFSFSGELNDDSIPDSGFLDHGIFLDLAIMNILGEKGISLGGRWNYRQMKLYETLVNEEWHSFPQFYLHYNF